MSLQYGSCEGITFGVLKDQDTDGLLRGLRNWEGSEEFICDKSASSGMSTTPAICEYLGVRDASTSTGRNPASARTEWSPLHIKMLAQPRGWLEGKELSSLLASCVCKAIHQPSRGVRHRSDPEFLAKPSQNRISLRGRKLVPVCAPLQAAA